MEDEFELADKSVLFAWLVDRIASGFGYDSISQMYRSEFTYELKREEFDKFYEDNFEAIDNRNKILRKRIEESGIYTRLNSISQKLYDSLNNDQLNPKEMAQVADTLNKYSKTLIEFGKVREEKKSSTTNNFLILQGLEQEGIIKIMDNSKLKYLLDGGVYEEKETEVLDDA